MCGIFGAVKSKATDNNHYLELILELGQLSEERGRHSAGLAFYNGHQTEIHKDLVRFSQLPIIDHVSYFASARVVLGHTRFATQGSAHDIQNVSPMALNGLVGTHNGDVEKKSIPNHKVHQKAAQSRTDTEILFRELQGHEPGDSGFVETLEKAYGRIALAFISNKTPNFLTLVRGAISPLAYAYTQDGTFVYASNPNWFRIVEARTQGRVRFSQIAVVPEGVVLSVSMANAKIYKLADFTPTCRETDLYFVNSSAYKNFVKSDKDAFNALTNRAIARAPQPTKPLQPTRVEGYKDVAPQRSSYEPGMLFDDVFLEGKSEDPFTSEFEERVSLDHIETLCDSFEPFDEEIYEYLLSADSEEELEARYSEVIVEAFNVGQLTFAAWKKLGIPEPLGARISVESRSTIS